MKLYELKGVQKFYGNRCALSIDSLSLNKERFYSLYGPNGSGKTTLLNLLAFLDMPTRGSIFFEGKNIVSDPERVALHMRKRNSLTSLRKRVTLIMENPYLFQGDVLNNLIYGLAARSLPKKEMREKVEEIIRRFHLQNLKDRNVKRLSEGERRLVALVRAVVLETDVLLLDEPTAHLDRVYTEIIEDFIFRLNREDKRTIIMSTHNLEEAERFSQETIFLEGGKIWKGRGVK